MTQSVKLEQISYMPSSKTLESDGYFGSKECYEGLSRVLPASRGAVIQ